MTRQDVAISIMGHLTLAAIFVIFNPATTRLGPGPEVMTVDLGQLPASGPEAVQAAPPPQEEEQEEVIAEPPQTPQRLPDADIEEAFAVNSPDTLATIVEEKPEPEPEPEEKPAESEPSQTETREPETVVARADTDRDTGGAPQEVDGGSGIDVATAVTSGDGAGYGNGGGSFNLPYNIGLLQRKIERLWRNPVSSPTSVYCTVYFQIGRDGLLIGEPVLEKSSGMSVYDQNAIWAIKRVDRFPEFPADFEYDYIGIHMEFAYVP